MITNRQSPAYLNASKVCSEKTPRVRAWRRRTARCQVDTGDATHGIVVQDEVALDADVSCGPPGEAPRSTITARPRAHPEHFYSHADRRVFAHRK